MAFVLCWLPFHVGRTIFFFSMGTISEGQTAPMDSDAGVDKTGLARIAADADIGEHAKPISRSDSDARLETRETTAHAHAARGGVLCDACPTRNGTRGGGDDHPGRSTREGDDANNRPSGTLKLNPPLARVRSQNNTRGRATPSGLYDGAALNDTRFDATHAYFLYYLSQYFNLVSSVLFYLSAAVNPLLYNLMSDKYRHAVRSLVHTHSRRLRTLMARHSTTTL